MTKEKFAAAVRRMREVEGGYVTVTDWAPAGDRAAYRYAKVRVMLGFADAPARCAELAKLAIELDGYLGFFVNTAESNVWLDLSCSRDLDAGEIPDGYFLLGAVDVPLNAEAAQ